MSTNEDLIERYLIDKGYSGSDVSRGDYLEVLKELLAVENRGHRSNKVDRCSYISIETIALCSIVIPNMNHFSSVEPRLLESPGGNTLIAGVLVRCSRGDVVADGYHRLKHLLQRESTSALFIVISDTKL